MINKYEERLGTERMLPLVFKMALPAVAAQFVNLLYSMVDRIYIGHIPGIGTDALAFVTSHTLVRIDRRRLIVRNSPMTIISSELFLHPLLGVTSNFQFSSPIVNV